MGGWKNETLIWIVYGGVACIVQYQYGFTNKLNEMHWLDSVIHVNNLPGVSNKTCCFVNGNTMQYISFEHVNKSKSGQVTVPLKPELRSILGEFPSWNHHLGWSTGCLVAIIWPDQIPRCCCSTMTSEHQEEVSLLWQRIPIIKSFTCHGYWEGDLHTVIGIFCHWFSLAKSTYTYIAENVLIHSKQKETP